MKWFPFAILALVAIVCQTTLVQAVAIRSIRPEWTFILAVHYALWGPWPDAAIAAWVLGLAVDLQSAAPNPVGLHAFTYGAAAWVILRIRNVLFRDHPATQVMLTLAFAFAVRLLVGGYFWWRTSGTATGGEIWWEAFLVALYTAAWAPLLHWPLIRLAKWTGLRTTRRFSASR